MSSNYSGQTTPHSDVDHPHRITCSPFNEEEDPQPVPMLPPRPPTPGPIALENKGIQTSPKPCPIHQQHVAIITTHIPPFARQIQQPPTLQEALELRKTTTPANKEKPKEKSTELSMTSRGNGTGEWRNSPNNKTNPTTTTTKPSTTSTRNHLDFRILMEISDHRQRVMLRFHYYAYHTWTHPTFSYSNP